MYSNAARKYTQKTYRQITKAIIRMMKSIPTITPITIHFQLLFSLSSIGFLVVVVVVVVVPVGVKRAFTLEMVAPIAPSSSDLYKTVISTKVLLGNIELFPINNPRGCCT